MLWRDHRSIFACVDMRAQWDVHAFYQPSKELSDTELLAHRRAISKERPSLPSTASKHFRRLAAVYFTAKDTANGDPKIFGRLVMSYSASPPGPPDKKGRRLRLAAVANPEPGLDKIVLAVLSTLDEQARKEAA